ncbi:MAG TPA: hypothetical protein VF212_11500 [Longimicrobiales bacterium]
MKFGHRFEHDRGKVASIAAKAIQCEHNNGIELVSVPQQRATTGAFIKPERS